LTLQFLNLFFLSECLKKGGSKSSRSCQLAPSDCEKREKCLQQMNMNELQPSPRQTTHTHSFIHTLIHSFSNSIQPTALSMPASEYT